MNRQIILARTISAISKLPDERLTEVSHFADFLLKNYEEQVLISGIQKLASESKAFNFLEKEEELYSINDLKIRYK